MLGAEWIAPRLQWIRGVFRFWARWGLVRSRWGEKIITPPLWRAYLQRGKDADAFSAWIWA